MSAIIGTSQYVDYFNNPHGIVQGGIGAALAGGSVIGAIMAGPVSNYVGRRDAIFFACLWWLLGTALQTSCNGIGMLVAGRFINGICVGITSSQVPVYLVEISKKEKRGSIVVIQQWAIEWGIFIMYFVGYGKSELSLKSQPVSGPSNHRRSISPVADLSHSLFYGVSRRKFAKLFLGCSFITGNASFRTAWGIQFVPCAFLMCGLPFLPRSPRWLAKAGRVKEAVEILARIQAHGDINDPLVVAEWEEITTVLAAERGMNLALSKARSQGWQLIGIHVIQKGSRDGAAFSRMECGNELLLG